MVLPSRKVLSLMVLTIALVASIIIVFGKEKSGQAINFANNLVAGEKFNIPENDSWQTEVNQVAKPIDVPELAAEEQTVTDTVSTTILSNYLALKQNDALTQESAQKIIDGTEALVYKPVTKISAANLNLVADNGKINIAEYGERLGTVLKNNKPKENESELQILQEIMSNNSPEKIKDLQVAIDTYKNIAAQLKKIPVPTTFIKAHIDTVNGMLAIVAGLEEIKNVFNDPIRALQGIRTYQEGGDLFITATRASSEFIKKNKVIYEQGTGGYYLLYGI